jgi:MFS family permease
MSEPKHNSKNSKPRLWTRDFTLITLSNLMSFITYLSMPTVLPVYLVGLGFHPGIAGAAVSIAALSLILTRPFIGLGVKKYGRRVFYVTGLVLLLLTFGPIGLVPPIALIFVLRFFHGVAWGFINTTATTIAADVIPRERFGEGIGFFTLSNALALAIAPALALALLNVVEFWLLAFLISLLLVVSIILSQIIKYKPIAGRGRAETPLTSPTVSTAPAANDLVVSQTREKGLTTLLRQVFDRRAILPGCVVFFANMAYGAVNAFVALAGYDAGVQTVFLYFVAYALAAIFSRPLVGRLVDRSGYRIPATAGLIAIALAVAAIAIAHSLWLFLLAGVLFGFGQGCSLAALQTMAVADASYERRGTANSTFLIFFDSGLGVGTVVAGLIAGVLGYANMFAVTAILPLIAVVIFHLFARKSMRK